MYTSGNKAVNTSVTRNYLVISAVTALFGAVYEYFSHGVWSYSMVYAFAPSLILGALPSVLRAQILKSAPRAGRLLWRLGVAALTVGMIFGGVIEIYGTDSPLTKYYYISAAALLLLGLALCIKKPKKK